MRIKACWAGKTRSAPLHTLLSDYMERISHFAPLEIVEVPDLGKRRGLRGAALLAAEAAAFSQALSGDGRRILLDESGRNMTSAEFAGWIESEQRSGTREIAFILGGPEGVGRAVSDQADWKLSLGRMTWTHEMARVLLLEQVYRALSIVRNFPYHKAARGRK